MNRKTTKQLFHHHFEWVALSAGILMMGLMNPYVNNGSSWCLIERLGAPFCPGDGLGHSIAFIFRGDFYHAIQANILGPIALVILSGRIIYLIKQRVIGTDEQLITTK